MGHANGADIGSNKLAFKPVCEDPDLDRGSGAHKHMIPYLLALSDVSVVHLRDTPLFRKVIPSKIFEAMAMRRPIVLGLEGETREIVEEAEAGIPIPPEDAEALVQAVRQLKEDGELYRRMAQNGYAYVHRNHDRGKLARRYWEILEQVVDGNERQAGAQESKEKAIA